MRFTGCCTMRIRPLAIGCFVGLSVIATLVPRRTEAQDLTAADAARVQATTMLNFEDDIVPILQVRCLKCHGDEVRKGGLDLRRKFTIAQGGDGGPALVPGKPDESLILDMIEKNEMPPKDEEPLDAKQIDLLKRWVAGGAPTKTAAELPLEVAETEPGISAEDRDFWSFRPPMRPPVPDVRGSDRLRTPIDAFILARLESQGLSLNPDASRSTILRRLCFDLHGLPPTSEQIDAWNADDRDGACERLVDRLLEAPQYGERWARHWLDVAGYTDSDGGLDADRERPEAWRYRDYVIRAVNDDKPYDQFVREQIAGDELSDWRRAAELTPAMADELIATGFLRTAADPTYPGYKEKPEIYKVLADTMQIVGSTFLGVTIQCARCHEHKLEPISQRDYYQLSAVFAPALDPNRWLASIERGIPLATEARQAQVASQNEAVTRRVGELNQHLADLRSQLRREIVDERLVGVWHDINEEFRSPTLPAGWTVRLEGQAAGWKYEGDGERLQVRDITGKKDPGYAIVRLTRPVALAGEFTAECRFSWTSNDTAPENNTAMQVLLINLRDAQGQVVATRGYVDENNNRRGSPIGGVGVGTDVIAHNLSQFQQAAPPNEVAHALSASGEATITIQRDAQGQITTTHDDGVIKTGLSGQSTATVAEVEIELRRFILPGVPFEGLALDRLTVIGGPTSLVDDSTRGQIRDALLVDETKRNDEQKTLLAARGPRLQVTEADVMQYAETRRPEVKAETERILAAVKSEQALATSLLQIRGILDLDDKPTETRLLRRGDFTNQGKVVDAGVPAVLTSAEFKFQPQPGYKNTGRRRAFAQWLTDPANPTTARLQVNRIWAGHFGRGLVETLDDFGHTGKRPSHPELLDWLATEFVARGWSQKQLHRLIVTSSVYRQSSAFDPSKAAVDSENTSLWAYPPQRHQGETLRDSVLAIAGKLNPQLFGAPTPVARQPDGSVVTADDPGGNRRSIYLQVRRSQPMTLMEAFDTPKMEINCTRRSEAIVATQALTLLNSPFMESSARATAERIVAAGPDRQARIAFAWKLLYARSPAESERTSLTQFIEQFVALQLADKLTTATAYERVSAEIAAWPHLALILLNTNEFLYVD
ncbi:MAG: DUF1553 domain-containing protein [Planctomycetaceae bacterium]|nr:DUF1553 domain-containing protein [Planctomycetaceae bacterium]